MEWEALEFSNADAVISECRSAVSALERLDRQVFAHEEKVKEQQQQQQDGGTSSASASASSSLASAGRRLREALATLVAAIERRVDAIQLFYNDNDLNPLASQFEMCRLMLKRALMQHAINASGGALGVERPPSTAPAAPDAGAAAAAAATNPNPPLSSRGLLSGNQSAAVTPVPSRPRSVADRQQAVGAAPNNNNSGGHAAASRAHSSSRLSTAHSSFAAAPTLSGLSAAAAPTPAAAVASRTHSNSNSFSGRGGGGSATVTLKVILTRDEYEEVMRRRRANIEAGDHY